MVRRYRAASLAAALLLTTVGSPLAGMLGGTIASTVFALLGLGLTWAACVWCWGVARRPRPFRLVVAPVVQLVSTFFVIGAGALLVDPDVTWATALGVWLAVAGMFAFVSVLFAGFLRDVDFSTHAGV